MKKYTVNREEETLGEFTVQEINEKLVQGDLKADDLGHSEGMAGWLRLWKIEGIRPSSPDPEEAVKSASSDASEAVKNYGKAEADKPKPQLAAKDDKSSEQDKSTPVPEPVAPASLSQDKGKSKSNPFENALKGVKGMGLNNLLEGRNLVLIGAGMYGLVLVLQVLLALYYLGFLPWLLLGLLAQIALAAPFFLASKSKNLFPYALTVSVIIYVLFSGGLIGFNHLNSYIQSSGEELDNPRIADLITASNELNDELRQTKERFRLLDKAASERAKGNENSAKDAEEKIEKLEEKLSIEKKKELQGNLTYIKNQVGYRQWKDKYDGYDLSRWKEFDMLIVIGVLLTTCGAWVLRKEGDA